jgi:DNA invertase Pin-like site-specific DNA recombinase
MKEVTVQCSLIPSVVYAAKSTDDPRGSIDTQTADCEVLCAREGLTVEETYSDEAKSAYHGSRGDGLVQAREHAERLAAEYGSCALVVQHTDRLARGDGVAATHLVEILLWGMKAGVRIRSVQDDRTGESILDAAMTGTRNFEDSRRKALATAAGRRRAAERGEAPGSVPDGYRIERTVNSETIARRVVIDPERRKVYRLIWDMAIDGSTVNAIVRELGVHGYMTAPRKAVPRRFDAVRVGKVLACATYAGLSVSQGEIVGPGNWEPYVSPSDWHRLRRERSERARYRPEPVGRPPGGLLARLARCECGSAMIQQSGGPRKDGSRKRTYTCRAHMHGAGACSVLPYDAEVVERMVLEGLDELLGQAGVWSKALLAGRDAQRGRLTAEAEAGTAEVAACEAAIEQIVERYGDAVAAGDKDKIELAERAMAQRKQAAQRAATRHQAATDALAAEDQPSEHDAEVALARLYEALAGRLSAARGDVQALNGVLRDHFDAMHLAVCENGQIEITPVLSAAAVEGIWRETTYLQRVGADGQPQDTPWPVSEHRHWSYALDSADPEHYVMVPKAPVLARAGNTRRGSSVSRPPALIAEPSDQPGKQRQSHLPHNTRPGSSPDTAGGSPRRSRTGRLVPARS